MGARFARFAQGVADASGKPGAFVAALALVIVWAATGPPLGYSDLWLLLINTATTIVTFLMVFLIQAAQLRDTAAIQAKLDELLRAIDTADDRLVGIEKEV